MLVDGVTPGLLDPPGNVLRVSLHPDGLRAADRQPRRMARPPAPAASSAQVRLTADDRLAELLDELRGYPCHDPVPEVELPGPGDVVVPLKLLTAG